MGFKSLRSLDLKREKKNNSAKNDKIKKLWRWTRKREKWKKKKNKDSESIRWKSKSEAFVLYARLDTTPHTYITRVIRVSLLCFLLNYLIINFNNNNYSTSFHSLFSFFFFLKISTIDRQAHTLKHTYTHLI